MKALNVLLALLVSLALALGVLEGGLRLLGLGPPETINRPDETLGWAKRPDARVRRKTAEYDVELITNELGLRDDPMASPEKPQGVFRVVCLGDSFTLGYTVSRDDLFVDLLERRWGAEGRRVDVVNAGTEGYSTDQEAAWLLENGEAFAPDLVLLFPYDNDLYWNGQTEYFGKPKPRFTPEGELDHAGPFPAPPTGGGLALTGLLSRLLGDGEDGAHTFLPPGGTRPVLAEFSAIVEPPFDASLTDTTWVSVIRDATRRTGGALRALARECERLGARLVVAPIPSRASLQPETAADLARGALGLESADALLPDLPFDTLLGLCEAEGIDALDARPALRAAVEADGEPMHFAVDWHLSPRGNRRFAAFLATELARLGVFPAEHAATREVPPDAVLARADGPPRPPGWLRWFVLLWAGLTALYHLTYRDEPAWQAPLKVGAMLAVIFTIVIGGGHLLELLPPRASRLAGLGFVVLVLGFVGYKLGPRLATIAELLKAFTLRGHWYLMPLVTILLTIGSLLVVAASSPLVAPFIYTLF
jgi:hypothetical protein